jgi:hypothetical protein
MIETASPGFSSSRNAAGCGPALISPATFSVAGSVAKSAARTA